MSPTPLDPCVVRDPRMPAYYDRLRGTVATIPPAVPPHDAATDQNGQYEEPDR